MEKIELHVVSRAGVAIAHPLTAVFGIAGGTIGRGGHNKLVLPDADAGVARVHAMVRLETQGAYIANLCERRSLRVAGQEVLSGQEVRLHVGTEVHIGPYCLRAIAPGSAVAKGFTAGLPTAPGSDTAPPATLQSRSTGVNALACTPNVSASCNGAQPASRDHNEVSAFASNISTYTDRSATIDILGFAEPLHSVDGGENPFSILGRVESSSTPATGAGVEYNFPSAQSSSVDLDSKPAISAANLDGQLTSDGAEETRTVNKTPATSREVVKTSAAAGMNVFDDLGSVPRQAAFAASRPLIIPDDFDPFARDLNRESEALDPWAGGLPPKSLSHVANLPSDGLIRSLPLVGPFEHTLDNPAHSGLPKALDPKVETDPMHLFGVASVLDDIGGGSKPLQVPEFAQLLSLPQRPAIARQETRPSPLAAAVNLRRSSSAVLDDATDEAELPSVQAVDFLPTRPIDLGSVSATGISVSESEFALDTSLSTMSGSEARAAPSTPTVDLTNASKLPDDALHVSVGHSLPTRFDGSTPPVHEESTASSDALRLMDAFLAGANLDRGRVNGVMTPEFMHQLGQAFRVAVQGTIELLAARSEIKREFRADVTIIASRANNPLKFLPNSDGVIMQMVGECFPGFMKPVPAMEEAYFDLKVHQLALMAGIRAAYVEALNRFDPKQFEARCESTAGMLGKISSIARKAAVWDEYKQSYNAIRTNAEDDLVGFSGEAFVKAYDAAAGAAKDRQ